MWLRAAMGRWTKKQNFNLQPQFKKIKVKVTIERNITLSLHLVHSIEKTSSYILLVFGEGDVIGFSQWGLILFILFFQQLTPRILFVNMFSFLWSVLEEEGRFRIWYFLEVVSVFLVGYSFLRFVGFGIYGELLFPLSILRDSAESNRKYHRKENILHFVCTDKIAPSYQW